ncbi:putative oligomerization/nucleic acid binding protein [Haloactinospora alba]|uniref:Putative oligomerization/nucleic acid binding protein n=1 Tax=Haloactinospora alba TaxID=405555 RepID=A0A543NIP2_9ACTN|nr:DUF4429 domain-containing protein [Haloactinospora alba]TQN31708.1 putative oligomerization/nucleic acid binding protein [Haloactinospora alba]
MTELMTRDGTWTFDGENVGITPASGRGVHKLRRYLGEVTVPLAAIAAITHEPAPKGGQVRLQLRPGTDPLTHATQGQLPEAATPYRLGVDSDRTGVAEYFVDEVRTALQLHPTDHTAEGFILAGPNVPVTASASDGRATFDGETIRIEWNWFSQGKKDPRRIALNEVEGVDWVPNSGFDDGYLRFRLTVNPGTLPPEHDPNRLTITWGTQREVATTALLTAAVTAHLARHQTSPRAIQPPAGNDNAQEATHAPHNDPDATLRRLRELGELYANGVLTEEEFSTAKQALLRRM